LKIIYQHRIQEVVKDFKKLPQPILILHVEQFEIKSKFSVYVYHV